MFQNVIKTQIFHVIIIKLFKEKKYIGIKIIIRIKVIYYFYCHIFENYENVSKCNKNTNIPRNNNTLF